MKIYLAADHAGYVLKEKAKNFLLDAGYVVEDVGALSYDPDDDYPDFMDRAAKIISKESEKSRGIFFGGSGQGEAMVANRHPNVRAAVFYGPMAAHDVIDIAGKQSGDPFDVVRLSRSHNDANVLSIGARFVRESDALQAIKIWLEAPFSHETRHRRRIQKFH